MKKKITLIILLAMFLVLTTSITYSMFTAGVNLSFESDNIASFVFDAKKVDHLELNLVDLKPGEEEVYNFQVQNNLEDKISHVNIAYMMSISTYHFIPLEIKLYKVNDENEELFMTCDENYSRDSLNKLVCNTETEIMLYDEAITKDYKLKVKFPEEYNNTSYVDLVDFISIDIKSYQKTSE